MPSSIPDPPCIRLYSFHRGLPRAFRGRSTATSKQRPSGLAIRLHTPYSTVGGGDMDEQVGKGGCHGGQGWYMDPFEQARA